MNLGATAVRLFGRTLSVNEVMTLKKELEKYRPQLGDLSPGQIFCAVVYNGHETGPYLVTENDEIMGLLTGADFTSEFASDQCVRVLDASEYMKRLAMFSPSGVN